MNDLAAWESNQKNERWSCSLESTRVKNVKIEICEILSLQSAEEESSFRTRSARAFTEIGHHCVVSREAFTLRNFSFSRVSYSSFSRYVHCPGSPKPDARNREEKIPYLYLCIVRDQSW